MSVSTHQAFSVDQPFPVAPATNVTKPARWAVPVVPMQRAASTLRWLVSTLMIVVPVFLCSTLITFLLGAASGLSPAAGIAGDSATPATIAEINAAFGLDQPVFQQYLSWIAAVFQGDLGVSWFNRVAVTDLIAQRLGVTASVATMALLIGLLFGVPLGIIAAVNLGKTVDRVITAVTAIVQSLPPFVMAIMLIMVFSAWLRWVPSAGYVSPSVDVGRWLSLIALPSIALSIEVISGIARQLRTGLVATLSENYVTGAIVRGLSWRRIILVHVLRNGAGPALTMLGMRIPTLIGGAVVTETVFSMPGLGMLSADSALRGDVPIVQGSLVVCIAVVLCANVGINIVQGALQPASRRR